LNPIAAVEAAPPQAAPEKGSSLLVTPQLELSPSPALEQLIQEAFARHATDIHLSDGQPIFYRVHGKLSRLGHGPMDSVSDFFHLSETLTEKLRSGKSADFALDIGPTERLRISLFRSASGLSAAIRLLPREAPELSSLKLPLPIDDLAELAQGLVLVCGATGSGKSTTLAALAALSLKRRSILLTTLEDPIEFALPQYEHSIARRRQVGRDVCDFRTGLRDALRGDPDVILVGELRDPETIQLALTAAETGHLVLASLHSSGAASAIERIVDAYPAESRAQIRVQLADVLKAVVAQRLVPHASGQGRVVALELLRVTQAVANVIREGRTAQIATILQAGKREGMLSMDRCLAEYVRTGQLSLTQAQAVASDKDSLSNLMSRG
jgi:twitching motility protein PilT